ncbi:MAG: hypothetical protein WCB73_24090, partial [Pseudonocardiaceae bacterium]
MSAKTAPVVQDGTRESARIPIRRRALRLPEEPQAKPRAALGARRPPRRSGPHRPTAAGRATAGA